MNALPLVAPETPSLADVVDEILAEARAGHAGHCLWCGGGPMQVTSISVWTGEVNLLCPRCKSELSGLAPRRLGAVAR